MRASITSFAAVALAAHAFACPLCHTATGQLVRAGIFRSGFGVYLLATVAPFPVFLGVVALIYFGPPRRIKRASSGDRAV